MPDKFDGKKLRQFSPNLQRFLQRVWDKRGAINVNDHTSGSGDIYRIYSGIVGGHGRTEQVDLNVLKRFVHHLCKVAAGHRITCQGMPKNSRLHELANYGRSDIKVCRRALWTTFYHVHNLGGKVTKRAYVHAADWQSSVRIMKLIVEQFPKNRHLVEAKTAGPGAKRDDTIVAYFVDDKARDTIVKLLINAQKVHSGWFARSLPRLVNVQAPGIGTADEPPDINIIDATKKHQSYGTLYADIVWLALKTTPNLKTRNPEPNHLLDNVLYSLRLLGVNPRNPEQFPNRANLEAWYRKFP